jgi:hypothetical protein
MNITEILPAQFTSIINDTECVLELHLNTNQRVMGSFHADGETLEVYGGIPNAFGEVFGLLHAPGLEQPVAVFRANFVGPVLLEFEVDTPGAHDLMALENSTCMIFKRVQTSSPGRTMHPSLQGKVLSLQPEFQVQGKV